MDDLLNWLWQGCVVAFAACAILRLLERSRAHFRHVLCWIVLAIVLALPMLPFISLDAAVPRAFDVTSASQPVSAMVYVPNTWWTSTAIALGACVIWAGIHGIRLTRALWWVRQAKRRCRPFPVHDQEALGYWSAVRTGGRPTRLVLSDEVRSAAVLGCGSPVIAIAPALARHLDTAELDLVVMHEWAHVQRRDDLLNVVQLGVRAIAGWHPAVWWLDRQLQIEREAACDETVVALTGSPKGYAASLAKIASLLPPRRSLLPAVGALSAPGFRQRIVRILRYRRLVSARWSASAALTGALSVLGLAVGVAGLRLVGTAALAAPVGPRPVVARQQTDESPASATPSIRESRPRQTSLSARKSIPERATASEPVRTNASNAEVTSMSDSDRADAGPAAPQPRDEQAATPQLVTAALTASHVPLPGNVVSLGAPPSTSAPAPATPWGAAADTGVSVGRASQKAAVATAGFFSRLGKKVAGSFSDR